MADIRAILFVAAIATTVFLIWVSPWLLLPLLGWLVASGSKYCAEKWREPAARLGWVTIWATLPVGLAGLVISLTSAVVPPDDFLWVMLHVYDAHHWAESQVWLKPYVLVPVVTAAGVFAVATGHPAIISRLGRWTGLAGHVGLSLYVLTLFSFVTPGPFLLKLDRTMANERLRLSAQLQLQRDAEERYLKDRAVLVTLKDRSAVAGILGLVIIYLTQ